MKTTDQHPTSFRVFSFREGLFRLQSYRAFTLVELLVVIAMIAILAVTLLPALAASKDRGKRVQCASHLRQICVGVSVYAADQNEYLPPLKWRDQNAFYSYEMFRYTPVNVTPPTYDAAGGPYNLGSLWKTGILTDGKVYYCPGDRNSEQFTYEYYSKQGSWPFGGDPAANNPGLVRAGYDYYPQSRVATTTFTSGGPKRVPFWPDYNTSPEPFKTWICVPPFKQTEIDLSKSIVTDLINGGLNFTSHKSGNTVLGLNAGFGDGHVAWQGVNQNKIAFDPNLWLSIPSGATQAGIDFRFVQSCWQP